MIYYLRQTQNGFSLVEMLVAVSILLLVIVGPMTVTSRAAKSSSFSTEQAQAFFLAQEGLELAQRERDNLLLANFLPITNGDHNDEPWLTFTKINGGIYRDCYDATDGCGLVWDKNNPDELDIKKCNNNRCELYYDANAERSRFTHDAGGNQKTIFTRKIYFSAPDIMKVRVKSVVTWRTGSLIVPQTVEVETYLYNIYARP